MSNANQNDNPTDESGLRFYGIGIVTKDKPRNTDFIMVSPIEKISKVKGRLNEVEDVFEVESVDVSGVVSKEKITGEAHIKAKWMPMSEGNRQTAPDVIEGETVRLWRYGTSNEYYWQTMYREPSIRRLETVLYCYGNLRSGNTPWDKSSSYWHEVSTHDKYIWWKTTQSDGERFAYDFKIDTKNSNITIFDNVGNKFLLDSENTILSMTNADGSFVEINKNRYHGLAREHMTHESDVTHMKTPLFTVTSRDEGAYKSGPYLRVSDADNEATLGSGGQGFMQVKDGRAVFQTEESIDETTREKRQKAESISIESKSLNESYENVTREIGTLREVARNYERSGSGVSETLDTMNRDVGTANESYGTQNKTADAVVEKVGSQTSEVDKLEQTSKEQAIKSDSMKEEYGQQDVKVKDRTETLDSVDATVSGKEKRTVGEYELHAQGKASIHADGGVEMGDTSIANLEVPGKIQFGGEDLGAKLQALTTQIGEIGSKAESLEQKSTTLETELGKTNSQAGESKENTTQLQEDLDRTKQLLQDTGNRTSAVEDEISKLKTAGSSASSELESTMAKLKEAEAANQTLQTKVTELTDKVEFLNQLVEEALTKAEEALNATKKA